MKKYLISLGLLLCFSIFTAKAIINPANNLLKDKPSKQITLQQFLTLTPKQFQKATGVKLTFTQKIGYKLLQWKLKKQQRLQNPPNGNKADRTADFALGAGIMTWICALGGLLIPGISIVAIPFALIALIAGAVSHKKTSKKTKSVVGMVLGGLYLLLLGIAIIAFANTF
jgi:hypothetical protein